VILQPAADDLEGEAGAALEMVAEEDRIRVGAQSVDVAEQELSQLGALPQEAGEHTISEKVRDFIEVTDRMEALEWNVVRVVGGLSFGLSPLYERLTEVLSQLLLPFVEKLLRHFFPGESQVAHGRNQAKAHRPAG
jgi:hypothetical protein